jgi:hypothetical protein
LRLLAEETVWMTRFWLLSIASCTSLVCSASEARRFCTSLACSKDFTMQASRACSSRESTTP